MKTWADRDSKKIPLLPGVSVKQLTGTAIISGACSCIVHLVML